MKISDCRLLIGCAGWTIPAAERLCFPKEGSQLQRYAAVFSAVEVNSSFYRPHRATTYARWADSVPDNFRFSVKMPRSITHEARLALVESQLARFVEDCSHLRTKLGCLLVQLPPSLKWDSDVAAAFFRTLRNVTDADVCCEPRHPSWISGEANALFDDYRIARAIADPSPFPAVESPGPRKSLTYFRLHGSPRIYYSSYAPEYLEQLALKLEEDLRRHLTCWCIFDNTAAGAAIRNALELLRGLPLSSASPDPVEPSR